MFGNRVENLRLAHNWTQVQLAQKLSVSKQTNWENNNILPSVEMLIKLSQIFSVSTDYLLELDNRKYIEVTNLDEIKCAHIKMIIDDFKSN